MPDDEQFTPEEADVHNQAMLQDLRDIHSSATKAQSLENVRNRLLAKQRTSTLNSMPNSKQFTHKRMQRRNQPMSDMLNTITQRKGHYLTILAAGVIAALLVGSLLFVVTHIHQSNTGGGGPTNPAPIVQPTASPTCNSSKLTPTPAPKSVPGPKPTVSPTCDPGAQPTATPAPERTPKVAPGGAQPTATPVPKGAQPTVIPGVQLKATLTPG